MNCLFLLSFNVQASGQLAPCMAMHGFTLVLYTTIAGFLGSAYLEAAFVSWGSLPTRGGVGRTMSSSRRTSAAVEGQPSCAEEQLSYAEGHLNCAEDRPLSPAEEPFSHAEDTEIPEADLRGFLRIMGLIMQASALCEGLAEDSRVLALEQGGVLVALDELVAQARDFGGLEAVLKRLRGQPEAVPPEDLGGETEAEAAAEERSRRYQALRLTTEQIHEIQVNAARRAHVKKMIAIHDLRVAEKAHGGHNEKLREAEHWLRQETMSLDQGAAKAEMLVREVFEKSPVEAVKAVKRCHRGVRDVVMLYCVSKSDDPQDRDMFIVRAWDAYGGKLSWPGWKQTLSLLLLAYRKDPANKNGFMSNNQVAAERRGKARPPRKRKPDVGTGATAEAGEPQAVPQAVTASTAEAAERQAFPGLELPWGGHPQALPGLELPWGGLFRASAEFGPGELHAKFDEIAVPEEPRQAARSPSRPWSNFPQKTVQKNCYGFQQADPYGFSDGAGWCSHWSSPSPRAPEWRAPRDYYCCAR